MTAVPPPPTDLKSALEEMRASMVAEGVRTGLAGAIQKGILRLLSVLLTLVADFRAGRLPAPAAADAPGADCEEAPLGADCELAAQPVEGAGCTPSSPGLGAALRAAWCGLFGGHQAANGGGAARYECERDAGSIADIHPSPARIGGHSCEHEWAPVAAQPRSGRGAERGNDKRECGESPQAEPSSGARGREHQVAKRAPCRAGPWLRRSDGTVRPEFAGPSRATRPRSRAPPPWWGVFSKTGLQADRRVASILLLYRNSQIFAWFLQSCPHGRD
jgi:hypothetical protein